MKIRPSGYFNQLFPSAETRTTYIKEGAVPHEKAELCKTEVLDHAKVYDLLVAYNAPAEEIKHKKQALEKAMDAFRKEFPKGFYQLTLPHRSIEIKLGKESIFVNKIAPEEFASPVFEKFFTSGMKETKQEVKSIDVTEIVISDIFLNEGDAKSDRVVLQAFAEYLDVGVGPAFKEWSFKQILTLFYTTNFLFPGNNPVFSEPAFVERICTVESCFRSILELAEEQHTLIAARAVPEEIKQLQKALGQAMDAFGKEFRQLAVPHHCLEIKLGKSSIFINKAAPTQFKSYFIQKFFCAGMRESRQAVKTINLAKYVLSDALSEEGDAASDRMVLEAFADYIDHGVVPELKKWSYLQILTLFYVAQAFCHEENDPLLDKVLTVDLGTFMGQALARNKGFSMHIRAVRFSDSPLPSSLGYPSEEIRRTEKQEFLELIPLKPRWKSLDFSGLELRGNGYNFVNDEFIMAVSANCSNLRILNLSNSLITDKGLQVMAKKCPGVISVKQSGYGKIEIEISPAKAPGTTQSI